MSLNRSLDAESLFSCDSGVAEAEEVDDDPTHICFTTRRKGSNIYVESSLSERLSLLRMNGLSKAVAVDLRQAPPLQIHRRRSRSGLNAALLLAVKQIYSLQDFSSVQLLAQGFFSYVYRVTLDRTGRQMVLKMNRESHQRSVYREHEVMISLSHPNILPYHGVCVHSGKLHCLFDYINGGSLEQMLSNTSTKLGWRARVSIALDIATAMQYVHSQGYFHRDIASKNILIRCTDDDYNVPGAVTALIADFGLAIKIPRYPTQRLECVGSPFWMAPECINSGGFSTKADVFSFGIVLCELLTRVPADPDFLPRTAEFGLDIEGMVGILSPDTPQALFDLTLMACSVDPVLRPEFIDLVCSLQRLLDKLNSNISMDTIAAGPFLPDVPSETSTPGFLSRRQWPLGIKHNPFVTVRWQRSKTMLGSPPGSSLMTLLPTGPEFRCLSRSWSYPEFSQELLDFLETVRSVKPCVPPDDSGVSCASADNLGDLGLI